MLKKATQDERPREQGAVVHQLQNSSRRELPEERFHYCSPQRALHCELPVASKCTPLLFLFYSCRRVCESAGRYLTKIAYFRFSNHPVHVHSCMEVLFRASERYCSCVSPTLVVTPFFSKSQTHRPLTMATVLG